MLLRGRTKFCLYKILCFSSTDISKSAQDVLLCSTSLYGLNMLRPKILRLWGGMSKYVTAPPKRGGTFIESDDGVLRCSVGVYYILASTSADLFANLQTKQKKLYN
jgi:hypothetical protein